MPRIKITAVPKKSKLKKLVLGGPSEGCDEGYVKDEFGNCVPDFNYQPQQQGFGTRAVLDNTDYASMVIGRAHV